MQAQHGPCLYTRPLGSKEKPLKSVIAETSSKEPNSLCITEAAENATLPQSCPEVDMKSDMKHPQSAHSHPVSGCQICPVPTVTLPLPATGPQSLPLLMPNTPCPRLGQPVLFHRGQETPVQAPPEPNPPQSAAYKASRPVAMNPDYCLPVQNLQQSSSQVRSHQQVSNDHCGLLYSHGEYSMQHSRSKSNDRNLPCDELSVLEAKRNITLPRISLQDTGTVVDLTLNDDDEDDNA